MTTINLKTLHDEVTQVLRADQHFSIELEVWNHRHEAGDVQITVTIWDGYHHFEAATPAGALEQLRAVYQPAAASAIPTEVILP